MWVDIINRDKCVTDSGLHTPYPYPEPHASDCLFCAAGEPMNHNYEPPTAGERQCPGCETYQIGTHKHGADMLCDYHNLMVTQYPYITPEV
jgi:hypothetical protein